MEGRVDFNKSYLKMLELGHGKCIFMFSAPFKAKFELSPFFIDVKFLKFEENGYDVNN